VEVVMEIVTRRSVAISGRHYDPGERVEVDDVQGQYLVAIGKARNLLPEELAPAVESPEAEPENEDPDVEGEKPASVAKKRAKATSGKAEGRETRKSEQGS
jgi:hypothetical protein